MPNEFVARNGVIALNNSVVSGSLTVTQGITGSLFGTASWATQALTSSYILNAVSSSFAATASSADSFTVRSTLNIGGLTTISYNNPILKIDDSDTTTRFAGIQLGTNGGYWFVSNNDSTSTTNNDLSFTRASDGTDTRVKIARDTYTLSVYTGSNENVRLNANGSSYFNGGSLGVGTTSPGAKLEIYATRTSSTNATSVILSDNVTGGQTDGVYKSIRSVSNGGSSVSEIRFLETDGTNNNTSIAFATAPTAGGLAERMRINQRGDVGIGTVSPYNEANFVSLTIDGASGSLQEYRRSGVAGLRVFTEFGASGFVERRAAYLYFGTSATERMRITSTGNVGIGNTSPFALLHVGAGSAGSLPDGAGASFNPQVVHSVTSGVAGIEAMVNDGTFNRRIGLFMDQTNAVGGITMTESSTAIPFVIRNAGGERMRITSGGDVGIGTTSPSARLHVSGSTTTNLLVGTSDLFVSSSGNVGIGTNTPVTTLQVNGTTRATRINSTGGIVDFDAQTGNNFIQVASSNMSFANNGAVNAYISSSGNVGIGTASPEAKLDIAYSTNPTTATPHILLKTGGTVKQAAITAESSLVGGLVFSTGDGTLVDRMTILRSNGNVGIGTASPSSVLHVYGPSSGDNIRIQTAGVSALKVFSNNQTSNSFDFAQGFASASDNVGYVWNNANAAMVLGTNATERLRIFANGRVGVNTTTDAGYQFDVAGSMRTTGGANFGTSTGSVAIGPVSTINSNTFGRGDLQIAKNSYTAVNITTYDSTDPINSSLLGFVRSRGTASSPAVVQSGDLLGAIYFDGLNNPAGGNPSRRGASIAAAAEETFSSTAVGSSLRFGTAAIGSITLSERVRITAGGNVLIGTTTDPGDKLFIIGACRTTTGLYVGDTSAYSGGLINESNTARSITISADPGNVAVGSFIRFDVDGTTERARITSDGNVGIGTTTPGARLDVSGSAIISGSFTVSPSNAVELQVTSTGVGIGNSDTDVHQITGSVNIKGNIIGAEPIPAGAKLYLYYNY
jgi:hypothetical protein